MFQCARLDQGTRGDGGIRGDNAGGEAKADECRVGVEGAGAEGEDIAKAFRWAVFASYGVIGSDARGGKISR